MNARVILLIDSLGSGGAQRQIALLAREMSARGIETILVYYRPLEHMLPMLGNSDVKILRVPFVDGESKVFLAWKILVAIRNVKPTHLISFLDSLNMISGVASLCGLGFKWVPSERNLVVGGSTFEVVWRELLYRRAKAIVSNSNSQEQWLRSNLISDSIKNKLTTIVNGVSREFFCDFPSVNGRHSGVRDVIILGRLGYQKNPWLLLKTLELLNPELLDRVRFTWYGEEDPDFIGLREELSERSLALRLPLTFLPSHPRPDLILRSSSAVILCSRFEGTPNVVLEAMASRAFVIASGVSDVPLLLGVNERGLVFDSDCHRSLANAIRSYINMSEDRLKEVTTLAFEHVSKVASTEIMVDRFLAAAEIS